MGDLTRTIEIVICVIFIYNIGGTFWCDLDNGFITLTDLQGLPHVTYVSKRRDGTVWLRFGIHERTPWTYTRESLERLHMTILDADDLATLRSFNWTSACILSDMQLNITVKSEWNPSYISVFDTKTKKNRFLAIKSIKDCKRNPTLSAHLSISKQRLVCPMDSCALAIRSTSASSSTSGINALKRPSNSTKSRMAYSLGNMAIAIQQLNFDPKSGRSDRGSAATRKRCHYPPLRNHYSFTGSYYYLYVKVHSCKPPVDERSIGNPVMLRPHEDQSIGRVVIPSPYHVVLSSGKVTSWRVFAQSVSPRHTIYLQIWRPLKDDSYTLVGQTFYRPDSLRTMDIQLIHDDYISVKKGDAIGFYYPELNPVGYTTVPCPRNVNHQDPTTFLFHDTASNAKVGEEINFRRYESGQMDSCRVYSIKAIYGNKSRYNDVESWQCPGSDKNTQVASVEVTPANKRRPPYRRRPDGVRSGANDFGIPLQPLQLSVVQLVAALALSMVLFCLLVIVVVYYLNRLCNNREPDGEIDF